MLVGTSFVGINYGQSRRGFWTSDGLLELWLRLLALHVEDPVKSGSIATKIRDQWLLASRGYFIGCVPDGLEDAVATPGGEEIVRKAIHSILKSLQAAPKQLNSDVLNLIGIEGGEFNADIDTWRLIEVGQAFVSLLDGKIVTDASNSDFYAGCGALPQSQ